VALRKSPELTIKTTHKEAEAKSSERTTFRAISPPLDVPLSVYIPSYYMILCDG
jgi:hypothetical protein